MAAVVAAQSIATLKVTEKLERGGFHLEADILGTGSYSKVRKAWWSAGKCAVAIKIVDRRTAKRDFVHNFLPRELSLIGQLRHPHIIRLIDLVETGPIVCMVEELASHGDLLRRIRLHKRLEENQSRRIYRQLTEALYYLHQRNIAHRDLKCENILLDRDDNVKLGDFGFARVMLDDELSRTFCGSRVYAAPEILRGQPYSGCSIDIWSSGVILYIMVSGLMPYDDKIPRKMIEKQLQHRVTYHISVQDIVSDSVKDLIYALLNPTPANRPSYQEIIHSNWLRNTDWEYKQKGIVYKVLRTKRSSTNKSVSVNDKTSPTTSYGSSN